MSENSSVVDDQAQVAILRLEQPAIQVGAERVLRRVAGRRLSAVSMAGRPGANELSRYLSKDASRYRN